jgi:diguanylate cyclase (GGDEF)-like protein
MSQASPVLEFADARIARARRGELVSQLRAAAVDGDDARITRLLSELLRCKGLSRGQRISLQQEALLSLVQSLRSASLSDDLTGLHNRRAFVQIGTRVLDVATRDQRSAHLVYFCLEPLERAYESLGRAAGQMFIRQTGNLLRDLFPSYGVHEVLGRMGRDEFAALATSDAYASRDAVLARLGEAQRASRLSLVLSVGMAHFDPNNPASIDELLGQAQRDMSQPSSQVSMHLPVSKFGLRALSAHRV